MCQSLPWTQRNQQLQGEMKSLLRESDGEYQTPPWTQRNKALIMRANRSASRGYTCTAPHFSEKRWEL